MKKLLLALVLVCGASTGVAAQGELLSVSAAGPLPVDRTGEDVYRAACVTCHGPDGTGSPKSVVGFVAPLPDFSDCAFSTAEPDPDWHAVVHEGGPIRGLDRHMPAFGDALSPEDIALAIGHLRTFCKEPAWPRGDLNLPRAFFTEKAFPENESVWVTTFTGARREVGRKRLIYERRLGARNQIELVAPINLQQQAAGDWSRGLGDLAVAFKRTVYAELADRRNCVGRAGSRPPDRQGAAGSRERRTRCSSRSRCGARSCRATLSSRCTAVWSCPLIPPRAPERCICALPLGPLWRRTGLRPRVVAAGRSVVGAAGARSVRVGCRAAGAGDAVEAPARHGGRGRTDSAQSARGAPDAGPRLPALGLVRRRASSSSGNESQDVCPIFLRGGSGCARFSSRPRAPTRRSRMAPLVRRKRMATPTRPCSPSRANASRVTTTSSRRAGRMSRSVRAGEAP